jgi:hypothetical protein
LAKDIFNRLQAVTGAVDPNICAPTPNNKTANVLQFEANRWLAQLAVNIVDMIDSDTYMTPFNWFTTAYDAQHPTGDWVYGTELPRLVMNEVYVQHDNQKNDPGGNGGTASRPYHVNVWVELHNPMDYTPYGPFGNPPITDTGAVDLEIGDPKGAHYPVYQILLTSAGPDPNPNNTDGHVLNPASIHKTATPWNDAGVPQSKWQVLPANQRYAEGNTPALNNGFYVVGPPVTTGTAAQQVASIPNIKTTLESTGLFYTHPITTPAATPPDLLLQRLVCPNLPPQADPTKPLYNPYITVDYFTGTVLNEARSLGPIGAINATAIQNRFSIGRNQPYAAAVSQLEPQNPSGPAPDAPAPTQPQAKHTFFRHNAQEPIAKATDTVPATPLKQRGSASSTQTLRIPFDWLVHLDRALASPVELMHVSAYKPYELTHRFVTPGATPATVTNGVAHNHRAAWFTQNERLYRLLEFVETRPATGWGAPGGRVPGKLNINTLNDPAVFRAFVNAQLGNAFTEAQADQVFAKLYAQRTLAAPDATGFRPPDRNDNPFQSLATGLITAAGDTTDTVQYKLAPSGRGIFETYLRADPNAAVTGFDRLLDPFPIDKPIASLQPGEQASQQSKYVRYEMLNKLFNNLTTRSNVFAVWLTVGFFEVAKDPNSGTYLDQTRPVKLGAEVGRAEGRNVRHRMFAIIDRTNLQVWPTIDPNTNVPTVQTAETKNPTDFVPANTLLAVTSKDPKTVDMTKEWNLLRTGQPVGIPISGINPYTNRPWAIQGPTPPPQPNNGMLSPGSVLTIDPDTDNEETVTVQGTVTAPTVTFTRQHTNGAVVISRGNPGPWSRYDPRKDPGVVPYFAIID